MSCELTACKVAAGLAAGEGRRFGRARVVSTSLSDYSRFGLFCSEHTNSAGEDIRYLARENAGENFLGGEVVEDPAVIVNHNY